MEIRKLDYNGIKELYEEQLPLDFPPAEIKPVRLVEEFYKDGCYEGYGYYDGEELLAYALFIMVENALLLDHIAVTGARRNGGIGAGFLKELKESFFSGSFIIAEVENPAFAQKEEDRTIMERRIGFYLRNGWRIGKVSFKLFSTNYLLISIGIEVQVSDEEILEIYSRFIKYLGKKIKALSPDALEKQKEGMDDRVYGWLSEA